MPAMAVRTGQIPKVSQNDKKINILLTTATWTDKIIMPKFIPFTIWQTNP